MVEVPIVVVVVVIVVIVVVVIVVIVVVVVVVMVVVMVVVVVVIVAVLLCFSVHQSFHRKAFLDSETVFHLLRILLKNERCNREDSRRPFLEK